MSDYQQAEINTTHGPIIIELWDDVAPKHVENFKKLTEDGFYDGLSFHRIIPGFVIQGGCPEGTGTGGPGWTVDAEFNDRPHDEGVLSMARSADPNSAGSQFFLCLGREHCQHLDGQYTGFGRVISGIDVVRAIGAAETDRQDSPLEPIVMTEVRMKDAVSG
ncbi:MAG: peptidylprolyl isomerase [Planctomycetota bacterium]|nr:peptidylprolyl isomerase [Planctomycetota bacterium]